VEVRDKGARFVGSRVGSHAPCGISRTQETPRAHAHPFAAPFCQLIVSAPAEQGSCQRNKKPSAECCSVCNTHAPRATYTPRPLALATCVCPHVVRSLYVGFVASHPTPLPCPALPRASARPSSLRCQAPPDAPPIPWRLWAVMSLQRKSALRGGQDEAGGAGRVGGANWGRGKPRRVSCRSMGITMAIVLLRSTCAWI